MEDIDLDKEFGPELPEKVEVVNFPENEKIGGLISDLKKAVEGIETKVNVTVGTEELAAVVKDLEAWQITTVEAINALPKPNEPKDYTKNLEEIKKILKREVDFSPIVLAISKIAERETKVEVPGFSELRNAIDLIGEKIENIKGFEIPEKLLYKDQIKVSVDRTSGGGVSSGKVSNVAGLPINPATEEKQDDIVTGIGDIEEKQDTLYSLIETLQELVQRLAPIASVVGSTAQLRVVQSSVPSTAVTGPITSAQYIAQKNVAGVSYTQRIAIENTAAIQSNINNVTA